MAWQLTNANDILIDLDGNRAYLEDNALWVYSSVDTQVPTAILQLNKTDLGEPDIDKLLNYIIFDFVGTWTIYVYYDNVATQAWQFAITDNGSRTLKKYWCPLSNPTTGTPVRKAFKKMYILMTSNDIDATLYGMEIDFQVLKDRRYA